jgi:hypothetical protein
MAIRNKDGAWLDSKGDFVPPKYIPVLDKRKDQVVTKLANKAAKLNEQMIKLKQEVFEEVSKYIDDAKEFYDIDLDTTEGNKTLSDFANALRLEVSVKKQLAFDEKLELAKGLIDECIIDWSRGANDKLVLLVDEAFKIDSRGMIDRDRILGLRKLKIQDKKWKKAMEIIGDSLTVMNKKAYVRFLQKGKDGKWGTIYLDMSKV